MMISPCVLLTLLTLLVGQIECFTPTDLVRSKKSFQPRRTGRGILLGSSRQSHCDHDALCDDSRRQVPQRRRLLNQMLISVIGMNTPDIFRLSPPQRAALAMTTDKKTGIALPEVNDIENAVPKDWSIIDNPFEDSDKSIFGKLDSKPDSIFYADPRFVEHVDDNAVKSLTEYISNEAIQEGDTVLDLCSSWTSHYVSDNNKKVERFSGLGMNAKELEANKILSDWVVQDLNIDPNVSYGDNTFDAIVCQLSIDYLTRPLDVMKEAGRILKPGGKIHILFSNRLFLQKAVGLWTGADDLDHVFYVASYLHFSGGDFQNIAAKDLSKRNRGKQIVGDPLYVVTAIKGQ